MTVINYLLDHIWLLIISLIILWIIIKQLTLTPSQRRFKKNIRRQIPYLISRYFT
ncbi:MAG: hypothetical protein GX922_07450 [Firmicutes bacterium]|nr:hypothetical protein [Bacillota bacterium]